MKARAFDFRRATSIAEAIAAYAACDGSARYLAGGQSLLPALNLRLDAPDLLIDIAPIAALRGVERIGEMVRIGALTRHCEVQRSPLIRETAPLLSQAAAFVAHPAIRNRGTIGGSIALADPASEFPACLLALDAQIEITGQGGVRTVRIDDFFHDLYETALAPGELLSAILVPAMRPDQRTCFDELARRRGDYAMVGVAVNAFVAAGRVEQIRLAFCAMGATCLRARSAEKVLVGTRLGPDQVEAAKAALSDDLAPDDDDGLSGENRLRLARVLLGRVLGRLLGDAAA